jgi:hypothetical protein
MIISNKYGDFKLTKIKSDSFTFCWNGIDFTVGYIFDEQYKEASLLGNQEECQGMSDFNINFENDEVSEEQQLDVCEKILKELMLVAYKEFGKNKLPLLY